MIRHERRERLTRHHEEKIEPHVQMRGDEVERRIDHEVARRHQRQQPQRPLGALGERTGHPEHPAVRQRATLQRLALGVAKPQGVCLGAVERQRRLLGRAVGSAIDEGKQVVQSVILVRAVRERRRAVDQRGRAIGGQDRDGIGDRA